MQFRWTLAAVTLAAAAVAGPAQAEDPVADLLRQAEDTAYQTVTTAGLTAGGAVDRLGSSVVVDPPATPREARALGTADFILIEDLGKGPVVSYGGVLQSLWDCDATMNVGASVVATCTPQADKNIDWHCGLMGVTAIAHSKVIDFYDHAVETLQNPPTARRAEAGPNVPDPRPKQWGQVAGLARCDGYQVETAQAGRDNPVQQASTTMGAVTAFTCEARRSPGSPTAPVPQYTVKCVDPVDPTTLR